MRFANRFCWDFNEESQSLRGREIEASAEIEAAEVEAEEKFEALGIQVSRAWSTCKEQLSARQQVSDAEAAGREEVRKGKYRLEKMRELAKAAAAGAEGAAERKVEASRQPKSISCRTEAARSELEAVEWSLECSVTHCMELEAFAALCEQRAEEENQAEAAEERAMAEEVWIFEDLSFQGLLEKERKLIQDDIQLAIRRTIEVESAIKEAVSYCERSTRELLKYMENSLQSGSPSVRAKKRRADSQPIQRKEILQVASQENFRLLCMQ